MTRAELIQFINANIYPNGRNQITAPMVRDSILAVVGFLGDAAVKDIGAVLENNTDLVTGGAVYDAIRAYLSSVMKMVGETTTDVITNPTANPIYVDGVPHTAQKGDVVVYGYKEFWWTGSIWKELGDEASWALKTITITGTGDLTGGGTLEANRTLDLTQSAKDKLAHGETAFSWLESYSTNRLRLKSPYSYLNARKGLILEEETDYTNTPADFVKQVVTVGETEYTILRSKLPIVSDSFISAGGISPGGGASGTTLQAVWDSLTTNTGDYANAKIHSGHIPLGSGLGVDGSGNIYVTSQGTVTGIKIGSTTYTPSAGSTIVDISSGIPTSMAWSAITSTPTTLSGYGITDAKIESGVITLGSSTITPLTSHQTIYNLVINNSAGTAQITYKPNVSGTYSLTLTSAMVGLGNVENTALSTWAGTSNITTLGTISTGVWQGTSIGYNYVAAHYIGRTRTTASAAQATLLGIDAISNASSSGSSDASRIVWDSTNNAWHFLGGIYADSFISAGGLSSGGGTSGIDLAAMWASLQNNDIGASGPAYEHRNDKIHTWHLPQINGASGISASYREATTNSGLADYLDFSVNTSTLKSALAISTSDVSGLGTMATQSASDFDRIPYISFAGGTSGYEYYKVSGMWGGTGESNSASFIINARSNESVYVTCGFSDGNVVAPFVGRLSNTYTKFAGFRYSGKDLYIKLSAWCGKVSVRQVGANTRTLSVTSIDETTFNQGTEVSISEYLNSGNFIAGTNYQAPIPADTYHPYGGGQSLSITASKMTSYGTIFGYGTYGGFALYPGIASNEAFRLGTLNSSYVWQANPIIIDVNGNVGVGGLTPSYTLDVKGKNSNFALRTQSGTGDTDMLGFYQDYGLVIHSKTSSNDRYLFEIVYGQTTLGSGGTVALSVRNDGKIGVGKNNPGCMLDVNGNVCVGTNAIVYNSSHTSSWDSSMNSGLRILNTVGASATGSPSNYSVALSVAGYYGFQFACVDASNRFFARTTSIGSPSSYGSWVEFWHTGNDGASSGLDADMLDGMHANEFDFRSYFSIGSSSSGLRYFKLSGMFDTTYGGTCTYMLTSRAGESVIVACGSDNTVYVRRMLNTYSKFAGFKRSGDDLYIETDAWSSLCAVRQIGGVNRTVTITETDSTTYAAGSTLSIGTFYHDGNANNNYTNWTCLNLSVNGNAVATGAITAGSASDMRLKENINTISHDSARDFIMALRPVAYRWNALATSLYDKYVGEDVGFVAQEVQPYMPVAISTIFEKYMRLDQTKFIAPLVSVAQDHETRIQQLERESREKDAKIAELENTIARLTN